MQRLIEHLCAKDDEVVERTIVEEYWYLLQISCLYPRLNTPKWRVVSLIQFAVYTSYLLYFLFQFAVTLVKCSDNLQEFSTMLHFAIIVMIAIAILIPVNAKRHELSELHRYISTGASNYDQETEANREELKKNIRVRKRRLLFIMGIYFSILPTFLLIIAPIINQHTGTVETEIYSDRFVSLNLPINQWTPLGSDTNLTYFIALLGQLLVSGCAATLVVAADIAYFNVSEHIILELRLLMKALDQLNRRAQTLYQLRYGRKPQRLDKLKLDCNFTSCLNECLKQCAQHHQNIIRFHKLLCSLVGGIIFFVVSAGSVIIGLCGITIVFAGGKIGTRVTSVGFIIAEVLNMYFDCKCSQLVQSESEKLLQKLYETSWWKYDRTSVRLIEIMMVNSKSSLSLTYNGVLTLNNDAFTTILNSAYSYFNILIALNDNS